jgi:beta-1,4-N-acetylglucosaminyltransferase
VLIRIPLQIGNAGYKPHRLFPPNSRTGHLHNGLAVEYFDYAPSLATHLGGAALVISHAGSGSIFEALRLGRPLVAVANPALMDNHQEELAQKLQGMGHLVAASPESLLATLRTLRTDAMEPYSKGDPAGIAQAIDRLMGLGSKQK